MIGAEVHTDLSHVLQDGFEIKTAYANKGMHFILLQKGERVVLASTDSVNVEYGSAAYYEEYEVRELTRKPS
ncbi:hypothetical protein [Litorimonas sp. WD9-15]|uniref:hypothetical protein n=1 Tax=Litorimonas sp. WD9-15 TaxID=3418716 RepID=UPI003CFFF86D